LNLIKEKLDKGGRKRWVKKVSIGHQIRC
jgi:hypothetical protein